MDKDIKLDEEELVRIEGWYEQHQKCRDGGIRDSNCEELLLSSVPRLVAEIRKLRENKSLIEQVAKEMVGNLSYVEREHNYYVKWFLNCVESYGEKEGGDEKARLT